MKPRLLLNLALLAAVAALAVFAFLTQRKGAQEAPRLSDLDPAQVTALRVERPGQAALVLEKRGGEWRITAPLKARADDIKVGRLLQFLAAAATRSFPAEDLARFDLDRPKATVMANDRQWSFGMVNPLTQEQYVLAGDAVVLVDSRLTAELFAPAVHLLSPRLLGDGEKPAAFELGSTRVEQREGKWVVFPAPPEPPSQDELNRWVNEWRFAAAIEVQPLTSGAKALSQLRLSLTDGRAVPIAVLARDPHLVLARTDEGIAYRFPGSIGERLLNPVK